MLIEHIDLETPGPITGLKFKISSILQRKQSRQCATETSKLDFAMMSTDKILERLWSRLFDRGMR